MGRHRAPREGRGRGGRTATIVVIALLTAGVAGVGVLVLARSPDDVDRVLSTPQPTAVTSSSPTSTPTATATPTPTTRAATGSGRLDVVRGATGRAGTGRLFRYAVEVEAGIGADGVAFGKAVERTLADPRGWTGGGKWAFQRTDRAPIDFRVVLANPALTDKLCSPLKTDGAQSCFQHGRSVINAARWKGGAGTYGKDIGAYRQYLVNHEVGHALGYPHITCPGAGKLSPVMLQQTIGLGGCRPNPWPYPR